MIPSIPLVLGMEVLMKNELELLNFVTFGEHDLEYLCLQVTNILHHRIPLGATENKYKKILKVKYF